MTNGIRVGVQLWPGGTSDYQTWREAMRTADGLGTDAIFGDDHFHKPFVMPPVDGPPQLLAEQPDVNNYEGWTALASWGEITTQADICCTLAGVEEFRRKNAMLAELAEAAGRDEKQIERSVHWNGRGHADAVVAEGVTLFTAEIPPTDSGYDFAELKDMLTWRDQQR